MIISQRKERTLEKSFWFRVPVAKAMKFLFQLKNGNESVAINKALASSMELKTDGNEKQIIKIKAEKRTALKVVMAKFEVNILGWNSMELEDIFWIRQLLMPKEMNVERIR
jgi:hypothetical protein